jgi:hypothetical protein
MKYEDMFDATKAFLETLPLDDLLDLGTEINQHNDRECDWAWRMDIGEEMYCKAESALYEGSADAILKAMEWAQSVKGYEFIDIDGDPCDRDDLLERAKDNIDDLADNLVGSVDHMGNPDTYYAIDGDELLEYLKQSKEWQDEYAEEQED